MTPSVPPLSGSPPIVPPQSDRLPVVLVGDTCPPAAPLLPGPPLSCLHLSRPRRTVGYLSRAVPVGNTCPLPCLRCPDPHLSCPHHTVGYLSRVVPAGDTCSHAVSSLPGSPPATLPPHDSPPAARWGHDTGDLGNGRPSRGLPRGGRPKPVLFWPIRSWEHANRR